jgi:hypothetical protein
MNLQRDVHCHEKSLAGSNCMTAASVITNIQAAWAGIMESTMNALWKMHPQCTDSSGGFGKSAVNQSIQEDESELLTLWRQPSSKGFKDSQSDDTKN